MFEPSENVRIELAEVENAEPLAGTLFQRSFQATIPDFPKHFILLAIDHNGTKLTLGYVHHTRHENIYLGGGMCVDAGALRKIPKTARALLSKAGGAAFYMLSESVKRLNDADAVFGYVGHKGAYKIDLAVGFEPTQYPHLIVFWNKELPPEKQQEIIEKAHQVGPF